MLDHKQQQLLQQMEEMGYTEKSLNFFKLSIYKWNIDDTINYYESDSFCHLYCIDKNNENYGCCSNKTIATNKVQCQQKHSLGLKDLIHGTENKSGNLDLARILCQYLIYLNKYETNPMLFYYYGYSLYFLGETTNDFVFAEKLYQKCIRMNNRIHFVHENCAILLEYKLKNLEKAEYHYKVALKLGPNDSANNSNLGLFLIKRGKYRDSLKYCENACKLNPNNCRLHYNYAKSLYYLHSYNKSIKEFEIALNLNGKFHSCDAKNGQINELSQSMVSKAREYISEMKRSVNALGQENVCCIFCSVSVFLIFIQLQ